jgi:uncharacterized membrane protein (UPF0127 family)
MKKIKVQIADKIYTVELAETEEQHDKGLQNRDNLEETAGMLFIFEGNEVRNF